MTQKIWQNSPNLWLLNFKVLSYKKWTLEIPATVSNFFFQYWPLDATLCKMNKCFGTELASSISIYISEMHGSVI